MICSRCNSEVADGLKFCNTCGNKLSDVRSEMNSESEETTLLEDTIASHSAEETTLLEGTPSIAPTTTIQPEPNNPAAPKTDYRYTPKTENNKKEKLIVVSAVIVAVIFIAVVLILT